MFNKHRSLALCDIYPNPEQPRKEFAPGPLAELADSIKTYGVQSPIKVVLRPLPEGSGDGTFMIVMGERRYRASILAGKTTIPCIVEEFTDDQVDELALIENIQREDLNIVEEAKAYQRMLDKGMSVEELAKVLSYKQPWRITERTSILRLRAEYQELLVKGHLTPSQAFEISRVTGEEQALVFTKIREGRLDTYEKLRAFVTALVDKDAQSALFDIQPLTEKERAVLTSYEGAMDKIVAFLNRTFKENELLVLKKVLRQNRPENIQRIEMIMAHLDKVRKALQVDAVQEEAVLERKGAA